MSTAFLNLGPRGAATTILLAHGAGAPMDSAAMSAGAEALAEAGLRVVRFEFGYMASRRTSAARKPPPRAETLIPEYLAAIDDLGPQPRLVIGGKSMGGRIASMIADEFHAARRIAGLLCLGYPFHPIGKPDQLRTAHLAGMKTPTLIVQGTRDPFGTRDEVAAYKLSPQIEVVWVEDGDHDLKARKSVTGQSAADQLRAIGEKVALWAEGLAG